MFSCNLISDHSFDRTTNSFYCTIRKCRRNGTDKPCGTLFIRHSFKPVQKHLILDIIGSINSRISGRINSRLLIQIINLKPGIICQNNIIRQVLCDCLCLNLCVFLKCGSILYDININSSFFHRIDRHSQISQDHMDLFHLILISGCKNNSLFHLLFLYFFAFGGLGPINW